MSNIAVRVKDISKEYHISHVRTGKYRYETIGSALTNLVQSPFRWAGKLFRRKRSEAQIDDRFWALRDISFDINHGEVVGIIGRNGAGKSTLLKTLSRITEPTRGSIDIYGRVGSLLEVGTGFHPELTGRENIFLNGAILGMRKTEISRKFDEIVAFSEVEKFIDTPVKHYSSGMYLRLAFAVAAHLEPEILIVDEVLAVGDARFQKKCLNKMQDVGDQGRTVLFVSHNMPAVTRLCQRVILLHEGRLLKDGSPHEVVSAYLNAETGTTGCREWPDPAKAPGGEFARLRSVRMRTPDGQIADSVDIRDTFTLEMEYEVLKSGHKLLPSFHLYNEEGVYVFCTIDQDRTWHGRPRPAGVYVSKVRIPGNLLSEGFLFVHAGLAVVNPKIKQFYEPEAVCFHVIDSLDGDSARGPWAGKMGGTVRPMLEWDTEFSPNEGETLIRAANSLPG